MKCGNLQDLFIQIVKPNEKRHCNQDGYGTQFISAVSAKILEQRGIVKPTTFTKP